MLTITIPETELYDENKNEFINIDATVLQLEHSLVSLSKWESKWHKAFLSKKNEKKTAEETLDYIRAMTINDVDPNVYMGLTSKNIQEIYDYINNPMTAVYFPDNKDEKQFGMKDTPTSELIYYWMISLNIPFECQNWHLNRLMALIRVCDIKNEAAYNNSKKSNSRKHKHPNHNSYRDRRLLNESRLKEYGTSG